MKTKLKPIYVYGIGITIGALTGYLYYQLVGCSTGNCPLTASPLATIVWGALLGGVIVRMFISQKE